LRYSGPPTGSQKYRKAGALRDSYNRLRGPSPGQLCGILTEVIQIVAKLARDDPRAVQQVVRLRKTSPTAPAPAACAALPSSAPHTLVSHHSRWSRRVASCARCATAAPRLRSIRPPLHLAQPHFATAQALFELVRQEFLPHGRAHRLFHRRARGLHRRRRRHPHRRAAGQAPQTHRGTACAGVMHALHRRAAALVARQVPRARATTAQPRRRGDPRAAAGGAKTADHKAP
jgi:hypothetical protein